jgi:hypothetical protein
MVEILGIPKTALIGTSASWVTLVEGFSSATHDLLWLFSLTQVQGVAQSSPQVGWVTTADFEGLSLGPCVWSLSVKNKTTLEILFIASGSIFLETSEYQTQRLTAEAAEAAILKILQGGGNQSLSIKGRSSSKYGLAELQAQASRARSQMNRMLGKGSGSLLLAIFGG